VCDSGITASRCRNARETLVPVNALLVELMDRLNWTISRRCGTLWDHMVSNSNTDGQLPAHFPKGNPAAMRTMVERDLLYAALVLLAPKPPLAGLSLTSLRLVCRPSEPAAVTGRLFFSGSSHELADCNRSCGAKRDERGGAARLLRRSRLRVSSGFRGWRRRSRRWDLCRERCGRSRASRRGRLRRRWARGEERERRQQVLQ
jgi:hypothetical protein